MQSESGSQEQEEIVCRICRLEAEPHNSLFHPCKCSGTIKFVHQDCLKQWLEHSGHTHCEVCKHKFSFTPLYAPDAPSHLPWLELLWGLATKGARGVCTGSRVALVVFVWLSVVPLSTCWLWRLGFTRSLTEALDTVQSRVHPVLVFADCVQGSFISSMLIFLVLFVGYVWEQVRLYWTTRQAELRWERERHHQPILPQAPPPMRLIDRIRQQQQQQRVALPCLAGADSASPEERLHRSAAPALASGSETGSDADSGVADSAQYSKVPEDSREDQQDEKSVAPQEAEAAEHRYSSERQLQQQPSGHSDLSSHQQADTFSRDNLQMACGPQQDGMRGQARDTEQPQGSLLHQQANAEITQLASDQPRPMHDQGRHPQGQHLLPMLLPSLDSTQQLAADNAASLLLKNYQGSTKLQKLASSGVNMTAEYAQSNSTVLQAMQLSLEKPISAGGNALRQKMTMERLTQELELHLAGPELSDWVCLGVGYISLACLALTVAGMLLSWKVVWQTWRPRLTPHTLLHHFWARLLTSAGQAALMGKVMLVLIIELAVLPVAYGFWLDICALPLLEGSLAGRVALLQHAPVAWTLLHWLLGMACLMATAAFLSLIRATLRSGALPWLKDPFDPEGEPLQQVLTSPLLSQLEREATSLATMSCLAVLLVHLPIKLASTLAPSLFPLSFYPLDTVTEVPADMLLLHVCLPFTLPHLNVRQWCKTALTCWLRLVGSVLDLEHYLLPTPGNPQPAQPQPQHQDIAAEAADFSQTDARQRQEAGDQGGLSQRQQMPSPQQDLQLSSTEDASFSKGFSPQAAQGSDRDHSQQPQATWAGFRDSAAGLVANSQLEEDSEELTGRLLALGVVLMWSLLLLVTAILTVPCFTGRAALRALHAPLRHDLYCAVLGAYILWGAAALALRVHSLVQRVSGGAAFVKEVQAWLVMLARLSLLALVGLIVVPFMAGLYLDLVMLPFRARTSQTPIIFIYQDWACGVLLAKISFKIATSEGTLPRYVACWRDRIHLVQRLGVTQIPFTTAVSQILWPAIKPLALLLAIPYAVSRGIVPWLDLAAEEMQTLYTYGFALEYILVVCYYCLQHLPAQAEGTDFSQGSFSKESYYVTLGLFLLSVPGLWSQIKRAPKAKRVRKTFETQGPQQKGALPLDQRARQIFAYFKKYNYDVKDAGDVIRFTGNYKASRGQAAALTFYVFMGLGSTALVLSIAAPFGGTYWYALTLLSPLAGGYYWQRGSRVEEVAVKMVTADDDSTTDIVVEGDQEEVTRMSKELQLVEKGKVYVKGLLE
ncbi:hypothetical protein WJX79_004115 [Trebouxia sp. C0005]